MAAEEYFSTLESVQAKVTALRISRWLDPDHLGSPDNEALDSARQTAKDDILAYVTPRYGATTTGAWDSETRPDMIGMISDWLTLYHSLSGNNADHPVALRKYTEAIARLEKIAKYELMIPGMEGFTGQANETTRVQYLDCTAAEAAAGECDPCSYEYI